MSPEPTPLSPLSFEISPRTDRMKSFTLPANRKKTTPDASPRKSCYDEPRQKNPRKPPRAQSASSQSDQSLEHVSFLFLFHIKIRTELNTSVE